VVNEIKAMKNRTRRSLLVGDASSLIGLDAIAQSSPKEWAPSQVVRIID
jgi:hypothetical protein